MAEIGSTVRRILALLARGVLAFGVLVFLLIALFFVFGLVANRRLPTPHEWGLAWASLRRVAAYPWAPAGIALFVRALCFAPAVGVLAALSITQVWGVFASTPRFIADWPWLLVIGGGGLLSSVVARRIVLGPRRQREPVASGVAI